MSKWRHYKDPLWAGGGKTVCLKCRFAFADGAYHHVDEWRYCPMCGAEMRGKEQERTMSKAEYIFELNEALYNEETGEVCFKTTVKGELVRCKDCKHRDPEDKKCDSGMPERAGCVFPVDDDYYCAYGERG